MEEAGKLLAGLDARAKEALEAYGLPGLSICVVDAQRTLFHKVYSERVELTSPFRVGSISKLFTSIAVMQLVEQGLVNLDEGIKTYLPNFNPKNPWPETQITLRQLLQHKSGLIREPAVGHYFEEGGEASLEACVYSLNSSTLCHPPGTGARKYSNAGLAVAGLVVQTVSKMPFRQYMLERVLKPLGMINSDFYEWEKLKEKPVGYMWRYEYTTFTPAPLFDLGMAPCGTLHADMHDLTCFMQTLIRHGKAPTGEQILSAKSWKEMWKGKNGDVGVGFWIEEVGDHKIVSHEGALYGFSSSLKVIPSVEGKSSYGVAVVASLDCIDAPARLATDILESLVNGIPLSPTLPTVALSASLATGLEGLWRSIPSSTTTTDTTTASSTRVLKRIVSYGGKAYAVRPSCVFNLRVLKKEEKEEKDFEEIFIDDKLYCYEKTLQPIIKVKAVTSSSLLEAEGLEKVDEFSLSTKPADLTPEWQRLLLGHYGWDYNQLVIGQNEEGSLVAFIEWFFIHPLTHVKTVEKSRGRTYHWFSFPQNGMYGEEGLVFKCVDNKVIHARLPSSVIFKRRPLGKEPGGGVFLEPDDSWGGRPIEEVRKEALELQPPKETGKLTADLVELAKVVPDLKLDIRYARNDNFLGFPVYTIAAAFLQRVAAEALVRVQGKLKPLGYGLVVFDGYRPWSVTHVFWEATPPSKRIYVADPSEGSIHNRGCAVDLGLYDLATGEIVPMISEYDEMSARSHASYQGGTALERWHRKLLRDAMEGEGFQVDLCEWWHFNYKDARDYPISNFPFEVLLN